MKSSSILYASSVVFLTFGLLLPLVDVAQRYAITNSKPDTIIEIMEWNPFSEWGLISLALGLYHFCLGLMMDKRNS